MATAQEEQEIILTGFPISRGIAIGYPVFLKAEERTVTESVISQSSVGCEIERYRQAVQKSIESRAFQRTCRKE